MADQMTVEQAVDVIIGAVTSRADEVERLKDALKDAEQRCAAWVLHSDKQMLTIKEKTNEVWDREADIRNLKSEIAGLRQELAETQKHRDAALKTCDELKREVNSRHGATWLDILNENAAMRDKLSTIKEACEK